MLKEANAWL